MRRNDPYDETDWDENGILSNGPSFDESKEFNERGMDSSAREKRPFGSLFSWFKGPWRRRLEHETNPGLIQEERRQKPRSSLIHLNKFLIILIIIASVVTVVTRLMKNGESGSNVLLSFLSSGGQEERPAFVYEHPYISSSYYTSTKSISTLKKLDKVQVKPKKEQLAGKKAVGEKDFTRETKTRLAILRPFCAFDAGPLPTTFDCWQNFPPCRASAYELGDELDPSWYDEERFFDDVGSHMQRNAKAGEFLRYSNPNSF